MRGGEVSTTLHRMTEWVDLEAADTIVGYGVHAMTFVNSDGVGQACYLQLIEEDTGDVHSFLIEPELASRLGWEIMGVVLGHTEGAFAVHIDNLNLDSDEDIDALARELGLLQEDDDE